MLRRTPLLATVIAGVFSILFALIFEEPERPFTTWKIVLLYVITFLPSMGIAMLFDPASARAREEFLKINFYEEK